MSPAPSPQASTQLGSVAFHGQLPLASLEAFPVFLSVLCFPRDFLAQFSTQGSFLCPGLCLSDGFLFRSLCVEGLKMFTTGPDPKPASC